MIKRLHVFVLIFFVLSSQSRAQDSFSDQSLLHKLSGRVGIGIIQFSGDIADNSISPGISLQVNKNISHDFDLQAELIIGKMTGQTLFSSLCENPHHTIAGDTIQHYRKGERFNAEFIEFDINLLINLANVYDQISGETESTEIGLRREDKKRKLEFFAKIGIGLNIFKTLREELLSDQFINSYGYEWSWQNDFENAGKVNKWKDNVVVSTLVLGLITKYNISKRFAIDFSAEMRMDNEDKWDAKVNAQKSDLFVFYSLGTTFSFTKN